MDGEVEVVGPLRRDILQKVVGGDGAVDHMSVGYGVTGEDAGKVERFGGADAGNGFRIVGEGEGGRGGGHREGDVLDGFSAAVLKGDIKVGRF